MRISMDSALRCPVCRAGFRGTTRCSRCGADLTRLMTLLVTARHYRNKARKAICLRKFEEARALSTSAQKIHATQAGKRLCLLTSWLAYRQRALG
ncbi:MAG: hypothetical protein BA868_05890 [Desulfobacterales bacterium C00003106]|nr:MAG: hypothetical protein BA868_05890 [Desulfobacterales bacterium C00003106]OEU58491.1 MAG: hypothetical protein BAW33_02215 [Desulfobacterales bacterium C00003104]